MTIDRKRGGTTKENCEEALGFINKIKDINYIYIDISVFTVEILSYYELQ